MKGIEHKKGIWSTVWTALFLARLSMPARTKSKRRRSLKDGSPKQTFAKNDIFEADDSDPEEEKLAGTRYDVSVSLDREWV